MNNINLSKIISYILRHAPLEYDLNIQENGWVYIEDLLNALKNKHSEYSKITIEDILNVLNSNNKKRHEVKNGKIRALYGHSFNIKLDMQIKKPPEFLYHGTSKEFIDSIKNDGLKKMKRQYVHLSKEKRDAYIVAKRKSNAPIIIIVKAIQAFMDGHKFYYEEGIWLSEDIASQYLIFNYD